MQFKSLLKQIIINIKKFRRPAVAYCASNDLLPSIFVRTPSSKLREILFLPASQYETQLNQDVFALVVNRFRSGFFVEIGANDGYKLSNTLMLEEHFGWNGILIEANPKYTDSLKNRKSKVMIAAVVKEEGYYQFSSADLYGGVTELLDKTHEEKTKNAESIRVWGTNLEKILKENSAPEIIDFISIDVEGAEVPIVEQMSELNNYKFKCGCIEYNGRQTDYLKIKGMLSKAGYHIVWEGQTQHDLFFVKNNG